MAYYLVVHTSSAWVPTPIPPLEAQTEFVGCVWKWRHQKTGVTAKKWSPSPPNLRKGLMRSPVCRQTATGVIPSSTFVPLGSQRVEVLSQYKSRCHFTPCKYFERSKSESVRRCPYLNHCQFAHVVDGQKFTFSPQDIRRLKLASRAKKSPPYHKSPLPRSAPFFWWSDRVDL